MSTKAPAKTKAKTKAKPKKKGMDSDTKTLTMIMVGLGAVAVMIFGGVGAFTYFSQPENPKRTIVAKTATPDSTKTPSASAAPSQTSPSKTTLALNAPARDAYRAYEGRRSTFNPDTAFEPGEVVIAEPPRGFEDRIRPSGYRVMEHVNLGNLGISVVRVSTPPGMSVPDAIRQLATLLPGVSVDANHHYEESAATPGANPREMAGWEKLSPSCGTGLVLGQIDSGVDTTHPALNGQNIAYKAFTKPGRKPGPSDHGTSVAAMLVGKSNWGGLLPGAQLYAANMFELNEKGKKVGSSVGLMKAIDWLSAKNVHAVNLSIAGGDNKVVRKAFEVAKKSGLLLIAAVGNWGRADKPAYPAAYDHVVAVTATKGTELIYSHANQGDYVDFAAPGVGIKTALPGGGAKPQSGTSFATPYITAMAAILSKAGKTPDAASLRKALSRATNDLGAPGKDTVFGFGYVKARPACK